MSKLDWALGITVLINIIVILVEIILLVCACFISVQFIKPFLICLFINFALIITEIALGIIDAIKEFGY